MKIFDKIRKRFNLPNSNEKTIIEEGRIKLRQMAYDTTDILYAEERSKVDSCNTKCPMCGNVNSIVNKIANVTGDGFVSGNLFSIYGESSIETKSVNHCNKCGNQWYKKEYTYTSSVKVLADWFNSISTSFEGRYTFGDKIVSLLQTKEIPAESILAEFKAISNECYYDSEYWITLYNLRLKFKSVYDIHEK